MVNSYEGSCHCKNIQFYISSSLEDCFICNCSFCIRRAATLIKVNATNFQLISGDEHVGSYGKRDFSQHHFCKTCGIHCFSKIKTPTGDSVVANVACLQGIDTSTLAPILFDGANKL